MCSAIEIALPSYQNTYTRVSPRALSKYCCITTHRVSAQWQLLFRNRAQSATHCAVEFLKGDVCLQLLPSSAKSRGIGE